MYGAEARIFGPFSCLYSLKEAGLPSDVRFHDLRHTAATLTIRQGQPIPIVSKMLGHADPAMTLRRYTHVLDDMREDAARADGPAKLPHRNLLV